MPLVAIVGRPNVGKSTFFNRLTEGRDAIVHDQPGVTRDRIYGQGEWQGRAFNVVDTGGFVPRSEDRFEAAIREQVTIALEEADVIVLVVDTVVGISDLDQEMAGLLRGTKKPVVVLANKSDNAERRWEASAFYTLGLGEVYPVSAINGLGMGDLLDAVVEALPDVEEQEEDDRIRIAVIGRPNVGKSSLTNAWLGQNRSIVTEISGTTRDAIDVPITYHGRELVLVDTAGLRKRAKVTENIEFFATLRTERAIESCDIAVLLLDATDGIEAQDVKVLKKAEDLKKGLVIGINKWDLIEKETNTARDFETKIRERIPTMGYVPVVTLSATTKQRASKLLDMVLEVEARRSKRVPTSRLNEVMQPAIERSRPPTYRNQYVKIKYAQQARVNPPVFVFHCNHPQGIKEPYRRYLENRLREAFDFEGVPITISFRKK